MTIRDAKLKILKVVKEIDNYLHEVSVSYDNYAEKEKEDVGHTWVRLLYISSALKELAQMEDD